MTPATRQRPGVWTKGLRPMVKTTVAPLRDAAQVAALLNSPEIGRLIADLDATRWTGRPGYPIRTMVGAALVKSVYALPTWTRTVRLIAEHAALRDAIGGAPSVHACYRFTVKLREHGDALSGCLDRVLAALRDANPEIGRTVAIDGSDMPAYANGQRHLSKGGKLRERYSDPDASWGHRSSISTRSGGGYYGYKIHAAVCATTGLPLAWQVESRCCWTGCGTSVSRWSTPCWTRATTWDRSTPTVRTGASGRSSR
jgi:Transposase domain (DUF772)